MTKFAHTINYYKDGRYPVAFCSDCGAEGLKLLEDCPKEVVHTIQPKPIDSNKQNAK